MIYINPISRITTYATYEYVQRKVRDKAFLDKELMSVRF
jgi:hypothetical protein